jgi:hypothetical protein
MSSNTEELLVQARAYASKIHERDLFDKPHYSVAYNGLIHRCNKGGALDEVCINHDSRLKNIRDGEVYGYPVVNTRSQDEAIELVRLVKLYTESKTSTTRRRLPVTPSSVVSPPLSPAITTDDVIVVVKSNNKRKAVTESQPLIEEDETNVTASSPLWVRMHTHEARKAKALIAVAAHDVEELNLNGFTLRKAEIAYADALRNLKRARKDAIEDPIYREDTA